MKYISTRGNGEQLASAEAIIHGIAADGGLFVPEEVPKVSLDFIAGLQDLSYEERAEKVLGLFLTDYTEAEIKGCVGLRGMASSMMRGALPWLSSMTFPFWSFGMGPPAPSRTWPCSSCPSSWARR